MEMSFSDLRTKEVVNTADGKRLGKICDMAFYNCDSLRKISFGGSMSEWSKILIGDMNYGLYSASVVCSDSSNVS